ncbi:MAG: Holliday junction DNA helicase RuvA [Candidatus Spechtbacteria bacterium RIFCSPHIGHO2_02_FULL_43_15b]|uniref:Holliday junction branch migration complex subunit RuvA n=1 Tax=Candidatus Spechtbacteria bacterium RIFCSPHIGHO2_01_FULL_43_30 TaxID=1802158 RepID=A0A1G2H869_9BACT|nr:MAG: Holliday junction DNA helicase RuvA [Candidatus Spechtbacteria bacterium RIFCSPHIGHO2_01_FULL_43_30]OGZ60196.1 MAG: Holliday junction DNA helicase RuvA [Candidatus Spechtbacteria bacterium RIFCSPHIGHO2_02_FULL_43_15b]
MIIFVKGNIQYIGKDFVEVFCGNIGYKVFCPAKSLSKFSKGESLELFTHLHIREDAHNIYGFTTREERDFFEVLLNISGIGPKSALGILNAAPLDMLKNAIASGDMSILTRVSGIGQKIAQRIILELKGKLEVLPGKAGDNVREGGDVIEALVGLGYSRVQAQGAVSSIPSAIKGVENKVKEALKILAS